MTRRHELMLLGADALRRVSGGEDEHIAIERQADVIEHVMRHKAQPSEWLRAQAEHLAVFAYFWGRSGFPTVQIGHRLGAALMATRPPERDAAQDLMLPPWKAFCVSIPFDLRDEQNQRVEIIACIALGDVAMDVSIVRESLLSTQVRGVGLDCLYDMDKTDTLDQGETKTQSSESEFRLVSLCGCLLAGSLIELNEPKHSKAARLGPPPQKAKNIKRNEPQAWTFQLTRSVHVDCREWVADYMSGKLKKERRVRWLTRGHWQRYAVGPGRVGRRWQHREPYWNNLKREDAPIAVRSHILGDS